LTIGAADENRAIEHRLLVPAAVSMRYKAIEHAERVGASTRSPGISLTSIVPMAVGI
jgi:hypothetical protein